MLACRALICRFFIMLLPLALRQITPCFASAITRAIDIFAIIELIFFVITPARFSSPLIFHAAFADIFFIFAIRLSPPLLLLRHMMMPLPLYAPS